MSTAGADPSARLSAHLENFYAAILDLMVGCMYAGPPLFLSGSAVDYTGAPQRTGMLFALAVFG